MAADGYLEYTKVAITSQPGLTGLPIYVMFDNSNRKSLIGCGMSK